MIQRAKPPPFPLATLLLAMLRRRWPKIFGISARDWITSDCWSWNARSFNWADRHCPGDFIQAVVWYIATFWIQLPTSILRARLYK